MRSKPKTPKKPSNCFAKPKAKRTSKSEQLTLNIQLITKTVQAASVDLNRYLPPSHLTPLYESLTGRSQGSALRDILNLDRVDSSPLHLMEIEIPERIVSITTSFFLGCFGKSVRKAGTRDRFLEKYLFSPNDLELWTDINEGIRRALLEK